MKKTATFYLKTIMVILGALALISSAIMPIFTEKTYTYSGPSHVTSISSLEEPLWYCIILATAIVFALGYFFNRTVNVVLVFVLSPIFLIGIAVGTFLSTFRFNLFGPSVTVEIADGYKLTVGGFVLIMVATCISVLRKKTNKIRSTPDLLDE